MKKNIKLKIIVLKMQGLCRIDNDCITYKLLKDTEEKCKLTNFELNK